MPGKPNCAYFTVGEDDTTRIGAALQRKKYKVVCVNDDPMQCDFTEEQTKIHNLFRKKFPDPCNFEIVDANL